MLKTGYVQRKLANALNTSNVCAFLYEVRANQPFHTVCSDELNDFYEL